MVFFCQKDHFPGSPVSPFFIGWFPNHHFFSRGFIIFQKEPPFFKWWQRLPGIFINGLKGPLRWPEAKSASRRTKRRRFCLKSRLGRMTVSGPRRKWVWSSLEGTCKTERSSISQSITKNLYCKWWFQKYKAPPIWKKESMFSPAHFSWKKPTASYRKRWFFKLKGHDPPN